MWCFKMKNEQIHYNILVIQFSTAIPSIHEQIVLVRSEGEVSSALFKRSRDVENTCVLGSNFEEDHRLESPFCEFLITLIGFFQINDSKMRKNINKSLSNHRISHTDRYPTFIHREESKNIIKVFPGWITI